jgi:hypothetical protein
MFFAGISPLLSGDQSRESISTAKTMSYSFGKDGIRVTATFAEPAQTIGQVKIFATIPAGESLIAAHRATADAQGLVRLDASSVAIPSGATSIKMALSCDLKNNKAQDFVLPLQPGSQNNSASSNSCSSGRGPFIRRSARVCPSRNSMTK